MTEVVMSFQNEVQAALKAACPGICLFADFARRFANGFARCFNVLANTFDSVASGEGAERQQGCESKRDLFHLRIPFG
jgi:hypothetical protein